MASSGGASFSAWRLAGDLAKAGGEEQAAGALARAVGALLGADVVRIFVLDRRRGFRAAGTWPPGAVPGAEIPEAAPRAIAFDAPVAASADDAGFRSRLVLPLRAGGRPFGAVELLERQRTDGPYGATDAVPAAEPLQAAEAALAAARERERNQQDLIQVIERLSRLFDIGRSFTATLEMAPLMETIVNRVQAALDVEQAYLWLLSGDGETASVASAAGTAAEIAVGWELPATGGLVGVALSGGEPLLAAGVEAIPDLEERPDVDAGLEIVSAAIAPIADAEGSPIGAIEVVNAADGEPLEPDDLNFLQEIAAQAALALANARRLDAERRASDLGQLLGVSQELGAHLDDKMVAFTLVHKPAELLSFQRASVGVRRGARFEIAAVSGQTVIDEKLSEMRSLKDILEWVAGLSEGIYVVQEDDGSIDADRPETREKFRTYFEKSGTRSFLAVPLADDEGRLGVWALEAEAPYAFAERDIEAAQLLGAQATVALRNAFLFQQMPMRQVFQPLARTQARVAALGRHRLAWLGGGLLALLALAFLPVPLRVAGDARLLPERRVPASVETNGRVAQVLVREGDAVEAGQELARLDDVEIQASLAEARARRAVSERTLAALRAEGDAAGAAAEAARLAGLVADVERWETDLGRTRIRAREAGIVATPRVEDRTGLRLEKGDVFCEIANLDRQEVEIAIPEREFGLLAGGMPVKVRLYALPTTRVRAVVDHLGVQAVDDEDGARVFIVRAALEGHPEGLRSGMTGRAKVNTGNRSLGRVLFRRPARWLWNLVWGWLP